MDELLKLIMQKEQRLKEVRRAFHEAQGDDELRQRYTRERDRLESEIVELRMQHEEQGPELYSNLLTMDKGLADFMVAKHTEVVHELDKELARTDLYPNVRDWLFKKRRAFLDVAWFLMGSKDFHEVTAVSEYLLVVEYPEGTLDYYEAADKEEADEIEEELIDDDGIVTRYWCIPEQGSERVIYHPITEYDNKYRELPPAILARVVEHAGGPQNVRWPEHEKESA